MLTAARRIIRENGLAAVTIRAVLLSSNSPRGSVYHHFPGGRRQILLEALSAEVRVSAEIYAIARDLNFVETVQLLVDRLCADLVRSDFAACLPLSGVPSTDPAVDDEIKEICISYYTQVSGCLVGKCMQAGSGEEVARRRAASALAAIDGAVLLSRLNRSIGPLLDVKVSISETDR